MRRMRVAVKTIIEIDTEERDDKIKIKRIIRGSGASQMKILSRMMSMMAYLTFQRHSLLMTGLALDKVHVVLIIRLVGKQMH